MLATITDAAWRLTDASGSALAMWKNGVMVCRARSGDIAPALGAKLSAETGISGECLRSGKIQHCADTENDPLVDVEVCRSLGLRSIAVLPIQGWRGVNGILEVFSTRPAAFSDQHINLLQQLAALAERARALQPHGASPAPPRPSSAIEKSNPSGLLPASDRVGDVALAVVGSRSRPLVLGAISLAAIALLVFVAWLGWRGPDETDGKAHAAMPASVDAAGVDGATAHPPKNPPDHDRVWKANPGGELLLPLSKTSAGTPVKFASKVDTVAGKFHGLSGWVSHGVTGGQLVHRIEPVYPAQAIPLGLEGTVLVAATVMEDGTVGDVKVVDGPPAFAQSAMDAVKQWRYKPFVLDGKPVKNEIGIAVELKLPPNSASR